MQTYLTFGKASLAVDDNGCFIEFHSTANPSDMTRIRREAWSRGYIEDDDPEADPYDMQQFVESCDACGGYCGKFECTAYHECAIWRIYLIHRDTLHNIEEFIMPDTTLTAYGPFSGQMEAVTI